MNNQHTSVVKLSNKVFWLHAFCGFFFACLAGVGFHNWQKSEDMLAKLSGSQMEAKLATATMTSWEVVFIMAVLVFLFSLWTAISARRIRKLTLS